MERLTLDILNDRLTRLEHQSGTILFLSAFNMVLNTLLIVIGFLIGMP